MRKDKFIEKKATYTCDNLINSEVLYVISLILKTDKKSDSVKLIRIERFMLGKSTVAEALDGI